MDPTVRPFVGRQDELDALTRALADAERGVGSVWLLVGEPGIGKSRLVEEAARIADARGMLVAWGRAWEAGGAPAFWPWVQVLRTVLRRRGPTSLGPERAGVLAQLLPEVGTAIDDSTLRPEQARFRVLDGVVGALVDAAEEAPLCVVLEDLHAADPSSLLLLELLTSQIPSAPLLVLATHRESALDVGDVGPHLLRIARGARRVALRRFGRDDVAAFLARCHPEPVPSDLVDTLLRTSEGNPLFLTELARWIDDHRRADGVPPTLRGAIRERLVHVPADTLAVLEAASVLGREVDLELLAVVCGRSLDDTTAMLDAIATTGVLEVVRPRRRRFSHVLVREVLYGEIAPEQRAALHLRCADACVELGSGSEPRWSELAHHLLAAGPAGRDRGIEAAIGAAEQASARHAFDDAVAWFQRALDRVDASVPWMRRAELLLSLGRARMLAGDVDAGRSLCAEAAAMARREGAVSLLARAALEYGAVFIIAQVSETLVDLLREALQALSENETALRARVQARLAAALQPSDDPQVPIAMAREAVASARTLGDDAVLLDVVRSAGSALADLGPVLERRALDREHLALAERLGDGGEALRGATRLVFDALELGDAAEAASAVATCERWCERLGTVHVLCRGAVIRATLELYQGRFGAAAAAQARARGLSEQARDPNARRALPVQALLGAWLEGRDADALASTASLQPLLEGDRFERLLHTALEALARARTGAKVEIDPTLRESLDALCATNDTSALRCCAELVLHSGDRERMAELADTLRARVDAFVNFGAFASFVGEPVALFVARLEAALGRRAEAIAMLRHAAELSRGAGAKPGLFWSLLELAALGGPEASAHRQEAIAIARELGSPHLLARIEPTAPPIATPSQAPIDVPFSVRRLGDVWEVHGSGAPLYLRDTKGVQMLARLVDAPGTSIHVLELAGGLVDTGDAGPMIDVRARDAYRERIAALRDELEEAEAWNDSARAGRAREEVEALEAELARAVGLGGRPRRSHAAVERARVNVQRRLKDVVRRIAAERPELGTRLEHALRTGVHCCYDPDR